MARQYWPKGDAIGHKLRIPGLKSQPPYQPAASGSDGWLEIVGVVADARNDGLRNPIKPAVFVPYTLQMRMFTQILVRTRVPPLSILREVRTQLVQIDRDQQVMRVRDLEGWITGLTEYSQQRVVATLFGVFSVLAMLLAERAFTAWCHAGTSRTNGLTRMALGPRDVVRIVLAATAVNVGVGLAVGLVLSLIFDRLAVKWVTESSQDPLILAGVTVLLLTVAALACLAPARRAASVDPMEALRYE